MKFERNRISPLKEILLPRNIIEEIDFLAKQKYPREFARFMLGNFVDGHRVVVRMLYGNELESSCDHFRYSPRATKKAKEYAQKKNLEFIGTIHSHPVILEEDWRWQLILSGRDAFFMYRMQEHVRGIVALMLKENNRWDMELVFWAYGKHIPLKIRVVK